MRGERKGERWMENDSSIKSELLDLEEQIGNVYTGLSEEAILEDLRTRGEARRAGMGLGPLLKSSPLRRRQCQSLTMGPPAETEPCCICQEDFANGDDFHFNCIKQRLVQKNSCPIYMQKDSFGYLKSGSPFSCPLLISD
ncbi:hypothetical protein PVK06_039427 [Gossypium arboreum]|uniref:RING-type E3 ubiquitin transferase n=1 Tax=Gossypium arboreum TaxID=29729 RepID=A0ABR0N3K7_GOSAR|nr:hypothetical protein PVK06_039427 [Gossypium arboreum]